MTRLATICARGGSKSVQNKNLRVLAGRPLIRLASLLDVIAKHNGVEE